MEALPPGRCRTRVLQTPAQQEAWDAKFDELAEFERKKGHLDVMLAPYLLLMF